MQGFSGCRRELLTLHEWLTGSDDLPVIAISGEQGNGKSTVATAAAWNHFYHFSDGIVRVSAAGTNPFRLYDVVRTFDTILGTQLTRVSEDRWGISILEQLYRRKRLLIVDKLAGATERELATLVNIIGHLHESEGQSRILLIDRNFSPAIAELVQDQHLHLDGLVREDIPGFVHSRRPRNLKPLHEEQIAALYALTHGRPLLMRMVLGLLLDYDWQDLSALLLQFQQEDGSVPVQDVVSFAVESYAVNQPAVGPLLNRLVSAAGGASLTAMHELFWRGLGASDELDQVLAELEDRALLEVDNFKQRVVLHPVVRRYLEQNVVMLGEDWERTHARYYLSYAREYQRLPLNRWPEVDVEWGNIYQAADWITARTGRLWQYDALTVLEDPGVDITALDVPDTVAGARDDLRLSREYALALAYYGFWRHPLGMLRWLAAGALSALALKDISDYAWLQTSIGRQLFFIGRVDEAVRWLNRARDIFDRQDMMTELAYVHTDLGTSLRILDEPRRALAHFHAAMDCVVQTPDLNALTTAYLNLGSAYYSTENYERALSEHRKALRIGLRRNDDQNVASAFNNIGLVLEGLGHLDEARQAYTNALDAFRRIGDETGISACYNNLGSVCFANEDFADALAWYERDLRLSDARGNWTDMAATLHNLGHVALEQGDMDRAQRYFTDSRDLYAAFDLLDYVAEEEEMLEYIASLRTPQSAAPR
ncbi:MAG: tetratricopeptide repeat protein [Caldilineaceae bacterium]|nr:tetratricopeptide repeat protein [Caldilineaceae bacterium]